MGPVMVNIHGLLDWMRNHHNSAPLGVSVRRFTLSVGGWVELPGRVKMTNRAER